jgi:hypothetical protein
VRPLDQGCGNAHFPPNAGRHHDKANLADGPGGRDLQTLYSERTLDGTPMMNWWVYLYY